MLWTVTLQLLLRVVHNRDVTVTSTVNKSSHGHHHDDHCHGGVHLAIDLGVHMCTLYYAYTELQCIQCINAAMADGALHITTAPHLPHYNAMQLCQLCGGAGPIGAGAAQVTS